MAPGFPGVPVNVTRTGVVSWDLCSKPGRSTGCEGRTRRRAGRAQLRVLDPVRVHPEGEDTTAVDGGRGAHVAAGHVAVVPPHRGAARQFPDTDPCRTGRAGAGVEHLARLAGRERRGPGGVTGGRGCGGVEEAGGRHQARQVIGAGDRTARGAGMTRSVRGVRGAAIGVPSLLRHIMEDGPVRRTSGWSAGEGRAGCWGL